MAVKWKWKPTAGGGNVPANLENRVQTLENEVVKKTGDQSIAGTKTFTNKITANEGLTTGDTKAISSGNLELGLGSDTAYITPEDTSTKTLKYGGRSGRGRFNLDLENQSQLKGIKDPTADYHAANKKYVDEKIKTRTLNQSIGVGTTNAYDPTSGYKIVSFEVARKRSSDGFYFFTHNNNLNFQAFLKNETQYAVYNNGTVNDFTNDFRIVIVEMKV